MANLAYSSIILVYDRDRKYREPAFLHIRYDRFMSFVILSFRQEKKPKKHINKKK